VSVAASVSSSPVVVAVDVGKNCVALSVTGAGRHRLFGPVEFAMTRRALDRVVARIGAVLPSAGVVKVGVEAGEERGGEVFGVEGDDGAGTGDDRCGDDVFVVGVGEAVDAVEAFPAGDLGIVEGLPHLLDQVRCAMVGVDGVDSAADQFGCLFLFQFGQDDAAPDRPVHAFGGEGEQDVALQAGPEHAGVQQRGEHHRNLVSRRVRVGAAR